MGDIHIGPQACDEKRLQAVVNDIANDDDAYWIGLGDNCDFINRSDSRFDPGELAGWIKVSDLTDLARAQVSRLLKILSPIAPKCLALLKGNHEDSLTRHYERDVHLDVVSGIKNAAGWDAEKKLNLGYNGYLDLKFARSGATHTVKFFLHHGFGGGKLAGAKALNMQRLLWTNDVNIVLVGHTHVNTVQPEAVRGTNKAGDIVEYYRYGCVAGTFLRSFTEGDGTYAEKKGYFPLAMCTNYIELRPCSKSLEKQIKINLFGPMQRVYKLK